MLSKDQVIKSFTTLCCSSSQGFEALFTEKTDDIILERVKKIEEEPITYVQLNQLLSFANVPAVSDAFYQYYWTDNNIKHPYDVKKLEEYGHFSFLGSNISSLHQLKWGIHRIIIDCLLYFGNINAGFNYLHDKCSEELTIFFAAKTYDTELISNRGEPLEFAYVEKEDRYLISEMACKTYEEPEMLIEYLLKSYHEAKEKGIIQPTISQLIKGKYIETKMSDEQLDLSLTDILEEIIDDENEIKNKCGPIIQRFKKARKAAIMNTRFFLSLVHDLDVYMATSMRTKADFMKMTDTCDSIFSDNEIKALKIRYFDPTISATEGHEDKGLIECLMVKCCKVLVYSAGDKESYGKDAEAAMALSLGKPVIFLCEDPKQSEFFRNVHPLSRLIDFNTGVANGIMVANSNQQVSELLKKIFTNDMQYEVAQRKEGHYTLLESLTKSVVRLQTNDRFLSDSFWNYYQKNDSNKYK